MSKNINKKIKGKIKGYKSEFGTISNTPISAYFTLSGYIKPSESIIDRSDKFKALRVDLKRFVHEITNQMWTDTEDRLFFELQTAEDGNGNYNYFVIEFGTYYNRIINVRDKEFKLEATTILQLVQEYLEETREYSFLPVRPKNLVSVAL
jgi:hypothetical protein